MTYKTGLAETTIRTEHTRIITIPLENSPVFTGQRGRTYRATSIRLVYEWLEGSPTGYTDAMVRGVRVLKSGMDSALGVSTIWDYYADQELVDLVDRLRLLWRPEGYPAD